MGNNSSCAKSRSASRNSSRFEFMVQNFVRRGPERGSRREVLSGYRINRGIKHMRMANHGARKSWRTAKNFHRTIHKLADWISAPKKVRLPRACQRARNRIRRAPLGIPRAREGFQKQRHQFVRLFARASAAHGGTAAEMQPRIVSAARAACLKPKRNKVSSVSGSSAAPVKTRLPADTSSLGECSNRRP